MKTSSAKAKGRRLCAEIRELLLSLEPDRLSSDDIRVTSSGVTGEDIQLSPKAREIYDYSIECKCQERMNVWASWEQAKSHTEKTTRVPLLIFKRNRSETLVCLNINDFLKLTR